LFVFDIVAAHCIKGKDNSHVYRAEDISVILGAHNISKTNEPGRITAKVKSIDDHPDWNVNIVTYEADIAILELYYAVPFSDYILPVCLAEKNTEPVLNTLGYVAGSGGHEIPLKFDIARILPTPIYSFRHCTKSCDYFEEYLSNRSFCGGYANGTGVCDSDTGSGLIVVHEGIHYLRGIVSTIITYDNSNCDRTQHSIFTDVLKFYDWINTKRYD